MSRLTGEKGLSETLGAFKAVQADYPYWNLCVAGDGPIFSWAKEMGKNHARVHFKGHVSGKVKKTLLSQADIYVLPSYTEGLPTSVLEAMAFGCPVITTPVGGLTDFFKEGQMGYFVKLGMLMDFHNNYAG